MAMVNENLGQKWANRISSSFGKDAPSAEVIELWTGMAKDVLDEIRAGVVTTSVTGTSATGGPVTGEGSGGVM